MKFNYQVRGHTTQDDTADARAIGEARKHSRTGLRCALCALCCAALLCSPALCAQLSSVLGSVYKGGNVLFTSDGRYLLSPVGNRLSVFDLLEHRVHSIDAVVHRDILTLALSPDGRLLLCVDGEGGAAFVNVARRTVLCQMQFKTKVRAARFSPDSRLVAVGAGRLIQLWRCPALVTQFRPLTLLRTITGHYDDITWLDWSHDGKYLLSGSEDMSTRLHRIATEATTPEEEAEAATKAEPKVSVAGEESAPASAAAAAASSTAAAAASSSGRRDLPIVLSGHRGAVVACFFGQASAHLSGAPLVYSIGKDGGLFVWHWVTDEPVKREPQEEEGADEGAEETEKTKVVAEGTTGPHIAKPKRGLTSLFGCKGRFKLGAKHFFNQEGAKVLCAALHAAPQVDLIVVGFSSGVFGLYELPDFNHIHSLSISQKRINSVAISPNGSWLAFGCEKLGQLLVWEWQSESYILKQQGHFYDINHLSYSADGAIVATGGDDGKLKLWNTLSGFCFVTFDNHTAPITATAWTNQGNVIVTSSMDGTVRAFDLVRYRNFRTMTTPTPAQLVTLAVDPSGEIVCAGSQDPFQIYVWSMQTGKLLDVLSGHEGPLSALSFAASATGTPLLASSSWDKSLKLWDVYSGKGLVDTLSHTSDLLTCVFRADGKEVASATLDGNISFWDVAEARIKGVIEGRKDIQGGRRVGDARAASNATHNTAFTSLCYSADGSCILAGGNSKFVCIYEIAGKILLRKFVISSNLSMDGLLEQLNSKRMTEAGTSMDLIEDNVDSEHEDDPENRRDSSLPGAQRGDFSSRRTRLAVRSKCVRFAPTGETWAVATTDGLLLYGLDGAADLFAPSELQLDVTPANVTKALAQTEYAAALSMALALNQPTLIQNVLESVPRASIRLVVRSLSPHRLQRVLEVLSTELRGSAHLEYLLDWSASVLQLHAATLSSSASSTALRTTVRHLAKTLSTQHTDVAQLCNENTFTLQYLATVGKQNAEAEAKAAEEAKQQASAAAASEKPSQAQQTNKKQRVNSAGASASSNSSSSSSSSSASVAVKHEAVGGQKKHAGKRK